MFLKQEKPEIDDFERKLNFGSKGKTSKKFQYFKKILFSMNTPAKMS